MAAVRVVEGEDKRLDDLFAALANSTRRAILTRLAKGEATVNELAEPFDISLPAISKHIRVLEEVGLIEQSRQAQYRPCNLNPEPLRSVARWTEQYRPIWEDRFDRMDAYLEQITGATPGHHHDNGNSDDTTDDPDDDPMKEGTRP